MLWQLNDDFDINQRRRRLTRNIRIYVCVYVLVAGLIDAFLYHSSRAIQRKIHIGKTT